MPTAWPSNSEHGDYGMISSMTLALSVLVLSMLVDSVCVCRDICYSVVEVMLNCSYAGLGLGTKHDDFHHCRPGYTTSRLPFQQRLFLYCIYSH